MIGRERVFAALDHREPDRVPIYIWMFRDDMRKEVVKRYGSLDGFYDMLEIDMFQTFPAHGMWPKGCSSIDEALEIELRDPNDSSIYEPIKRDIEHHKLRKGRAIFCQTPGVFETTNGVIGIQNSLMELALHPEKCKLLYEKIARWAAVYAQNALELGVDVIHISDDWGENFRMMMNPKAWWELIYPTEIITVQAAKKAGGRVSLHCDGYFYDVLDGVVEMGIECVHPVQQSAGMDVRRFKREYGDKLALYGGLDIRYILPRAPLEELEGEIRELFRVMKPGGGFIFCTAHTVQPDTSLDRVEFAYKIALEEGRYKV